MLYTPSKTITPTSNIEREQYGYCVLSHGDNEVEAGDLSLNVCVLRLLGVVFKIKTEILRHIEFFL